MESEGNTEPKLPRSWAFHPAGKLHSEIWSEYLGCQSKDPELQQGLFEATKKQFLAAGESPLSHLRWREKERLLLCLEIIGDIEYELNRDHPSFTGSDTYEENGNDYDDLEYIDGAPHARAIPRFKEPGVTRLQLEESAAHWYLITKRTANFHLPISERHKDDIELPASVQYYRWERNNQKQKAGEVTGPAIDKTKTIEATKPRDEDQLSWDDLEGAAIDNKGLCQQVLDWLNQAGNPENQSIGSINNALKEAQRTASNKRKKGKQFPIKLRDCSEDFLFHRFAMIDLGSRGGKSSTYKKIKESKWEF